MWECAKIHYSLKLVNAKGESDILIWYKASWFQNQPEYLIIFV